MIIGKYKRIVGYDDNVNAIAQILNNNGYGMGVLDNALASLVWFYVATDGLMGEFIEVKQKHVDKAIVDFKKYAKNL